MSEEHQQQQQATTESNTNSSSQQDQAAISEHEENEQQVKNTEISTANKQSDNTNSTTTTYGSVDNEIWATITPQQNASLEALHQSMRLNRNSNGEGFSNMDSQTNAQQSSTTPQQQQASPPQPQQPVTQAAQPSSSTEPEEKPAVGSEEWHKQRRENHKQVERRRRENINEGINEIARIVPGCEKNKGSILNRAAVYIRQLKDTEAATLEKWTLEKLLTDQAISELNRQVEVFKAELERVKLENNYLKRELESVTGGDNHLLRQVKKQKMEQQSKLQEDA